jgi:ABC-type amino acid transport system permease subunit
MSQDALVQGLEDVVVSETRLSAVDGEAGELVIGGFPLDELAPNARFEETLYLLYHDRLPDREELAAFEAGAIALAGFATAHITEVVRGGIESIPHGQNDAAKAIGLHFRERLRFVILPQAMRRMLPPWVNAAVEMVKGSSLVSLIGVVDLLLAMQQVVGRTFIVIPFYAVAALFYFTINFSMSQTAALLERRFAYLRY